MKDLWSLRLQKIYSRAEDFYSSDGDSQVFSSQTDISTTGDEEESSYHRRNLKRSPKIIDSLALCYLGTLLLRRPVSISHVLR